MLQTSTTHSESPTAVRIREVATELFYEKGYHGTSMREIAAHVGIKAASLYNHFASKHDILFEIAFGTMHEMLEGAQAAINSVSAAEDQLRCLVEFHVQYSASNRLRAKVADDQLHALDAAHRGPVLELRDTYERLFRGVLRRGADECGWVVDDVAVVSFAIATMASAVGIWYRDTGRLSADAVASIYGGLATRAVVGPSATHPAPTPPA